MRKKLKLKCQEENPLVETDDDTYSRLDNNSNLIQPTPVLSYIQPCKEWLIFFSAVSLPTLSCSFVLL